MTRIVLDANFLRRGHFNASRLRSLADELGGGGVEFVVPEVVVWEWAEHAASTYEALAEQHRNFPVDPALYTLPAMPSTLERHDLVTLIEQSLRPGITVWRARGTEWREAVEAQVLQIGTGERKDGVKTGAADHLVLACVGVQLDERGIAESVVLATSDKNLRRACQDHFGDEVLLADSHHGLLTRLVEFEPAHSDLAEAVEEELSSRIKYASSEIGAALQTFEMGFEIVSRVDRGKDVVARELARLGRVEIVELHDLEVGEFEGGARVGHANVRVFGDVHMTVLELNRQDRGSLEWVQTYSSNIPGGMIDLSLIVTFDRDWNLLKVSPEGPARIDFDQSDDDADGDVDPADATMDQAELK